MCGLIGIIRTDGKDARKTALKRYEAQKTRGQQGYGFVALREDFLVGYERTEDEKQIKGELDKVTCDTLIFHHRIPTSTPNIRECNHPIRVSHEKLPYDYYVIHNGVIWQNETERLHAEHVKEGFTYQTQIDFVGKVQGRDIPISTKWNDSESLAIELAKGVESEGIEIEGSVAFIMAEVDKTTNKAVAIYWGSNGSSPLKFFEVKDVMITICSEGNGEEVQSNVLYRLDLTSGEISARPFAISKETIHTYAEDVGLVYQAEDYYELIEQQDELRRRKLILEHAGEDVEDIEAQIEEVESELREMETEFDKSQMALLNG